MSKKWAYCDPCGRWFYPEQMTGVRRTPMCPVCATESLTLAETPGSMVGGAAPA